MIAINPGLSKTILRFSQEYLIKRAKSLEGLDFEKLRSDLAEMKDSVLSRLEDYLLQFEEEAEKRGSQVLKAKNSDDANQLVLGILKKHQVRKVFKGKSMVSEEIGLNEFLEANNIEPRETDLGEWIIQLQEETPTHMVMPAIHLTKDEVAEILSKHLGRNLAADIPSLVRVAREKLRQEIFEAQAGLIGANALIAEKGAVMLITNEGNGRLVATIPPLLIVLTSIEKVIPTLQDALLLLKLLPRNATGQTITSYVSLITKSARQDLYIILVDNHRSRILADPKFREILRCFKCSACLNVCPVYQVVGGKEFSHVYMGGIGSLLTAWIHGLKESRKLAELCLGCHGCENYCPAKIRIADLIIELKKRLNEELGKRWWKIFSFNGLIGHPSILTLFFQAGRKTLPLFTQEKNLLNSLPHIWKKYDEFRSLPVPSKKSLSRLFKDKYTLTWGGYAAKPAEESKSLTLFPGCLVENFYPEIGMAAAKVLSRLGYKVRLAPPSCCGFPAANSGFHRAADRAYKNLLSKIPGGSSIVTLCPTCTAMFIHLGPELFPSKQAKIMAEKVFPLSQFIAEKEADELKKFSITEISSHLVTYHDSCHHKYFLKASQSSRKLLRFVLNREIMEMKRADSCCGFAGAYSISFPEISRALLGEKLRAIEDSGAKVVALDCPGCLLQIRGGCHRQGLSVSVKHTAEILDELLIPGDQ